ncbi:MAG: type II and III secretion system protein [Acidobacteria bacterium]|nr:type II and III secretion system protein [Acidobacteriota bacterium]
MMTRNSLLMLVALAAVAWFANARLTSAQQPAPAESVTTEPATPPEPTPSMSKPATQLAQLEIQLKVGRGDLQQFTDAVSRVSVSDPEIADAVVVSPHDVVINARTPGVTTAMVWHGENVSRFEVTVQPDLEEITRQMKANLPSEPVQISLSKDAVLLTGVVSDQEASRQAAAIAAIYAKSVVNLLQSPPPVNRQVMLQVKFATIDRAGLSELGVNLFSTNSKLLGTATTQQFQFPRLGQLQLQPGPDGQPDLGSQTVSVSDLLNIFAFRPDLNFGATLRLLQNRNLLEILAEPNLVTISGKEASFLAGGEFPFPVITSTGSGGASAPVVTIQFREFGVRLNFTPTVDAAGMIHLKVRPEVSALDFANALTIQGFLIPAISTRRAETEVDLREGESFAIAGLIDNRVTEVMSKVPGFGDVPILGRLFRSRSQNKTNTELLVVVTPTFVKPYPAGQQPALPDFPRPFLDTSPEADPGNTSAPTPTFSGPLGLENPEGEQR